MSHLSIVLRPWGGMGRCVFGRRPAVDVLQVEMRFISVQMGIPNCRVGWRGGFGFFFPKKQRAEVFPRLGY